MSKDSGSIPLSAISDGSSVGRANENRRHHVCGANSKSYCTGAVVSEVQILPVRFGMLTAIYKNRRFQKISSRFKAS